MKKCILFKSCLFVIILLISLKTSAQTGSALHFDGVDDHIEFPTRVIPSTGDFTVELWVNSSSSLGYKEFISQGDSSDAFYIGTDVSSMIRCGDKWISTGVTLQLNQWAHIALVKTGTDAILYLNGIQVASQSNYSISSGGSNTQLGTQYGAIPEFSNSIMDELRIWNIALSQSDIQSSMNCELLVAQTGLIANFHFNQGLSNDDNTSPPVNILNDASGNSNLGSLVDFSLTGSTSNWVNTSIVTSGISCDSLTFYFDSDNDGYGNLLLSTISNSQPFGYVLDSSDCNDDDATINPGIPEACNLIDDNCNGLVDDGISATYFHDIDNDGYGNYADTYFDCYQPSGYVMDSTDCNDNNASIHPSATEIPDNGIDDDCAGGDSTIYTSPTFADVGCAPGFSVGLNVNNGKVYIGGISTEPSAASPIDYSATVSYFDAANLSSSPTSFSWPFANTTYDYFTSVTSTDEGVYFYGASAEAVMAPNGHSRQTVVKYPLTGATGAGVAGSEWSAAPLFSAPNLWSVETSSPVKIISAVEGGVKYVYALANAVLAGYNNYEASTLTKFDTTGTIMWQKIIAGSLELSYNQLPTATGCALTKMGDYIYVISRERHSSYYYGYTYNWLNTKLDGQGNIIQSSTFANGSEVNDMTSSNGYLYVVAGSVYKFDDELNLIWQQSGIGYPQQLTSIAVAPCCDKLYVGGSVTILSPPYNQDALLLTLNLQNGSIISSEKFGSGNQESISRIEYNGTDLYLTGTYKFPYDSIHSPTTTIINGVDLADTYPQGSFVAKINTGCSNSVSPNCVNLIFPPNDSTYNCNKDSIKLRWGSGTNCEVTYKLYLGTNNPPTTIYNGINIGSTYNYQLPTLPGNTTYYWSVVATDGSTDATGCSVFHFTTGNNITLSVTHSPACLGDTFRLYANAVPSNLNYQWSASGINIPQVQNPVINSMTYFDFGIGPYNSDDIELIVTDSLGCTVFTSFPITVSGGYTPYTGTPICAGGDLILHSGAPYYEPAVFSWNGPNAFTYCASDTTIQNIDTTYNGVYTIVVNYVGGCVDSSSFNVIVNPQVNVVLNDTIISVTDSIQLNAIATNYETLHWTSNYGGAFNNDTILNPIYYPTSYEIYLKQTVLYLTAQSSSGCNDQEDLLVSFDILSPFYRDLDGDSYGSPNDSALFVNSPYDPPIGYSNNNLDCNDTNALINPNTFWVFDNDGDGYGNGNYVYQCEQPLNGLLFDEVISYYGDCNDNDASLHVAPIVSFFGLSTIICGTTPITLSGSPSGGTFSGAGITGNIFIPPSTGIFNISYNFSSGGCSGSTTQSTNVASYSATASSNSPVCNDGTLTLTATGGDSYSWSGPNGFSASTNIATITNITQADTGVYSVVIISNACSQTVTKNVNVAVTIKPTVYFIGLQPTYCQNGEGSILSGSPSGGSFSGSGVSTAGVLSPLFPGLQNIFYTSPPYLGCPSDVFTQTTLIHPSPTLSVSSSSGNVLCLGGSTMLTATTNASNILWSTGSTATAITVNTIGSYSVTVTDNNNCTASNTQNISFDVIPHIITSNGLVICPGEVDTLTFNTTFKTWNTGAHTTSITVSPATNTLYKVTGTSDAGCVYKDSVKIKITPYIPPGAVTNMLPSNNTINLNFPLTLSWLPGLYNTKFDLYLWEDGFSQPSTPYQSNLLGIGTILQQGSLSFGVKYNWRLVSKNGNCFSANGPIQSFTIRSLPDLITQVTNAPITGTSGQTGFSVSWQTQNTGSGITGTQQWSDAIYLSEDTILQVGVDMYIGGSSNVSALLPTQSYSKTLPITLPSYIAGSYYFIIKSDAYDQLLEETDSNNTGYYSTPITIELQPMPDLRITSVISPSNAFSGDSVQVTFTVKNFGTGAAIGPQLGRKAITINRFNAFAGTTNYIDHIPNFIFTGWSDILSVSDQPFLNASTNKSLIHPFVSSFLLNDASPLFSHNDTTLIYYFGAANNPQFQHNSVDELLSQYTYNFNPQLSTLLPDSSYTTSGFIQMPKHVFGQYYIYANTDNANLINEAAFDNNNQNSNTINVFLKPPSDLIVSSINAPEVGGSGQQLPFSYSVLNQGFTPPDTNYWFDKIYLANNGSYDLSNAILVGTNSVSDKIQSGSSYYRQSTISIPSTLAAGTYYFYVKTDDGNRVFEYTNEGNNILRADTSIIISNPDLQVINVINVANAFSGNTATIRWDVLNDGDANVNAYRRDFIFLSLDSVFDLNSALMFDSSAYSELIPANGFVTKQKTINIPNNLVGSYHVFVYTDFRNNIYESSFENNNVNIFNANDTSGTGASTVITIAQSPLVDLAIESFSFPDTIAGIDSALVSISIKNFGNADANGSWTDSLYISKKSIWNRDSAVAIASFVYSGLLSISTSYTINETVSIPSSNDIPNGNNNSPFYFYVFTDAKNNVYEGINENNNIYRASNSVVVTNHYVDHIVASVVGSDSAYSGQLYGIDWNVKNIGAKANNLYYNAWNDGFYLSIDTVLSSSDYFLGNNFVNTPLSTDSSYNLQRQFVITNGLVGNYYLIAYTDVQHNITAENNRTNNYNLIRDINGNPKTIYIVSLPPPDLEVTIYSVPFQGQAGQPVTIKYSVKNIGTGVTIPSSWLEKIYLSSDFTIDGNDNVLAINSSVKMLLPDSSYIDSALITLPILANGNYIFILKTDNNESVYEGTLEANNYAYSYITISQPPPSDLIVENITAPDTVFTGQSVTVNWTVQNNGVYPATGITTEAIYFSDDATWSVDDILFGTINANINIAPGSAENHTLTANLKTVPLGSHFVIARTDLLNNIIESDETNNITVANKPVFVNMKQLFLDSLTSDLLVSDTIIPNGTYININQFIYENRIFAYYHLYIPDSLAGQSLRIKLNGQGYYRNSLYTSFEKVPTANIYDYLSENPDSLDQEIIIPTIDSGTYYIAFRVNHQSTASIYEQVSLYADIVPFEIRIVDADNGGNTGNVTVKITGSQFIPNMQAHLLSNNSALDIQAIQISYVNNTTIYATFNLNHQPLGIYDVLLRKPDNTTALLNNAFEIETGNTGTFYIGGISNSGMSGSSNAPGCDPGSAAGINSSLQFQVNCPTTARIGRIVPMTILFGNAGNVDIPLPTRILSGTFLNDATGPPVGFTVTDLNQNNQSIYIEFREPGGPPNVLRAGANSGITLYTKTVRRGRVNFKLK